MSAICRHCRKPIKQVNWWNGPGWTHEDELIGLYCRITEASPMPTACSQCGWVGVGDCPRGPGDHE